MVTTSPMATSQAESNVDSPASWPTLDLPSSTIGDADEEDPPLEFLAYMKKMEKFRAHYSGIHGVILLLQTSLSMVVVSLLVCMALWKAEEGDLGDESSQPYAGIHAFLFFSFFFPLDIAISIFLSPNGEC